LLCTGKLKQQKRTKETGVESLTAGQFVRLERQEYNKTRLCLKKARI
jgi:hypothetical protein